MRSSLAQGERSFLNKNNARQVRAIIDRQAKRFGLRIYEFSLVANHFHLLARIKSRQSFLAFLRAISGLIARAILGAERGAAKNLKFWDARPFTRIVEWGQAFRIARQYLLAGSTDAIGFLPYRPNKNRSRYDVLHVILDPIELTV
jgi:REP element-mobilizing transposase RayT